LGLRFESDDANALRPKTKRNDNRKNIRCKYGEATTIDGMSQKSRTEEEEATISNSINPPTACLVARYPKNCFRKESHRTSKKGNIKRDKQLITRKCHKPFYELKKPEGESNKVESMSTSRSSLSRLQFSSPPRTLLIENLNANFFSERAAPSAKWFFMGMSLSKVLKTSRKPVFFNVIPRGL
jgi:hypothetical protein